MSDFKDTPDIQRFSDGETIVSEGIISNNAYIILKGQVNVSKKIEKRIIVIGTLKEGEVFGEMGLISSSVRSTNVSAIGEVTIGVINKDSFQKQLNALPVCGTPLIKCRGLASNWKKPETSSSHFR